MIQDEKGGGDGLFLIALTGQGNESSKKEKSVVCCNG